ncbi:putative cytochrome P450 [Cadophora sp. MPI-SDFR-AT-0126]|nr:putative cytochrome P450 [Leotiomycetes sp. MPI-SDFR-AT-0126]
MPFSQPIYTLLALLAAYFCTAKFLSVQRRNFFAANHGCKAPPALKQNPWLNGFDASYHQIQWMKNNEMFVNITRLFQELSTRTFSLRFAATTRIWTCDPENVNAVLKTKADDFELSWARTEAFRPSIGKAVQASNGEVWAHGRAILRPAFNKASLSNMSLFEEHFQNMRKKIPDDGQTVDLHPLLHSLTMDVATDVLFGESTYVLKSEANIEIERAYDAVNRGVIERFVMGPLIKFYRGPAFFEGCKTVRDYAEKYIEKALAVKDGSADDEGGQKSYEFIPELAKETDDISFIRDQILGALSGGRNTTASLISFLFYLLARNPDKQEILRKEIATLNGSPPTYEELKNLVYLRWVIDETLRILPTLPMVDRVAVRNTVLPTGGGPDRKSPIFVAKGQVVAMILWTMHRDAGLWGDDALEFKPERWEQYSKSEGKHVAFGKGPRMCPGQNLAFTEAAYTVVRMLQTCKTLETRDPEPFQEKYMVSLYSATGTQVAITV